MTDRIPVDLTEEEMHELSLITVCSKANNRATGRPEDKAEHISPAGKRQKSKRKAGVRAKSEEKVLPFR